jgi:hypothetical protein
MVIGCALLVAAPGAEDVAQGDDLAVGVRDLDADGALARDGREDATSFEATA